MVQIIDKIETKKARMIMVPKEVPEIVGIPGHEVIKYNTIVIPNGLNRQFLKKGNIEVVPADHGLSNDEAAENIFLANMEKDVFLRYAGLKPLSVVTDKFIEIHPQQLIDAGRQILGTKETVRYFRNDHSLQINFPVNNKFKGMNVVINTGSYGLFGGSGRNAVSYGVSWYNSTCSNWTLFLKDSLEESFANIAHRKTNESLENRLLAMKNCLEQIDDKIEESKSNPFTYSEMDRYLSSYEGKGMNKGIANAVREENPNGTTAYNLSYRLTQLCQDDKMSDTTRSRIEYLAGELIICYNKIKDGLGGAQNNQTVKARQKSSQIILPRRYLSMN